MIQKSIDKSVQTAGESIFLQGKFFKKWHLSVNVNGRGGTHSLNFAIVRGFCRFDPRSIFTNRNDRCGENWSADVIEQFRGGKTLRSPGEMAA